MAIQIQQTSIFTKEELQFLRATEAVSPAQQVLQLQFLKKNVEKPKSESLDDKDKPTQKSYL